MAENKIRLFTIPNMVTLGNLLCGCMAVVAALVHHDLRTAFWLVVAAAVLDFLDGFTARMLKSYSALGVQLDSLSDMVSFGLVPGVILYSIYNGAGGAEWWAPGAYAVFAVTLFSALRLAKFNIDEEQKDEFIGMPTPACAIFIASAGWLYDAGVYEIAPVWVLVAAACLSWLLISPIRMFSLKFHNFSFGQNKLRYIFVICSLAAVAVLRVAAVPIVITAYIIVSIVRNMACKKG